jgi:hypothetical protein
LAGLATVVVLVALDRPLSVPPPFLQCFLRRLSRDQAIAAVADQILPPDLD